MGTDSERDRLRVAVVGLGVGALHVDAFTRLADRFEVVAVCDHDRERARAVAARTGARAVTEDDVYGTDDVDVVDLCTPPSQHFDQVVRALRAGHHVICEKPVVGTVAEIDALRRVERESPGTVMPVFQYRWGNGFQELLHLRDAGTTGAHRLTTIELAWRRDASYYAAAWRGKRATELGGVLLTHAIHLVDLLRVAVGPVQRVFARTATLVNPIETEDTAVATFELADGSLATLAATLGAAREWSRLAFTFEHLAAESNEYAYLPTARPWTVTARDPVAQDHVDAVRAACPPRAEHYDGQLGDLADALTRGDAPPVTLTDARATLSVVEAMYRSAEAGTPIVVEADPG
jgi:predicted dehydrogenase